MSLTVTAEILAKTTSECLTVYRENLPYTGNQSGRELSIDASKVTEEGLLNIKEVAESDGDGKTARAVESIIAARHGVFDKAVPNFKAFQAVLTSFLKHNLIDGWIYTTGADGEIYPELITNIVFDGDSRGTPPAPKVRINTVFYGRSERRANVVCGVETRSYTLTPQDVVRRRVADILAARGLYHETEALKNEYSESMERYRNRIMPGFAKQFRVTGSVYYYEDGNHKRIGAAVQNHKVIHDLDPASYGPISHHAESILFESDKEADGAGKVPEHPVIRVFDLATHEFIWVHSDIMTPYQYDKTLRDKLILPKSHRDLLDVLTTDLGAFVDDIIEGKSAGNVILGKGIPGVGKTLTAEVYSELIETPLYAIHSGSLGTSAEAIARNLRAIFLLSKRWGCVLLLDEADVFVVRRGGSIEQNAIVAEFLRTLEYFDGLLFMTTNRPDDIDDAIISRCAAIIDYQPPSPEDAAAIWRVMAEKYEVTIGEELIANLVALFPKIAPRDIKMLFRLALRVSKTRQEPLELETFRRCAMFRAVNMKD